MWPYILALTLSYLLLVRLLRYRMYNHLQTKYSTYLSNPNKMPYQTAHEILKTIMLYESPFIFGFSLQWALIKSYGIANGTKLLVATRRLTDTRQVAKRSEDTGIILAEILVSGIDSERGRTALAKMNWIHAQYGNRISNGDLIHTLALFVLEPARWARRWDWRGMSVLEETALWCYWREVGMRMGMKDLPSTLDELKIWTRDYESTEMRYSENNRKCYDATVGLFLRDSPGWLKPRMQKIADAFLEPYVRPTLGVDAPPAWAFWVVDVGFGLRAFYIRYLSLPRFKFLETGARKGVDGRIQRNRWLFEPWYVGETMGSRMRRFLGLGKRERVPGPQWFSQGYLPEELGPHEFLQRSREPVLEQAEQLKVYAENGGSSTMGCPFAFAGR